MVSELATPLSANARTDPPMDPFDRAILLCKQMLAMLSGPVVQPEDSDVDQELAAGCDNAASSPDGEMPAKCSTLGLSPDVGGVEAADTSQQSGSVSTVSPGPVGASPPSTMQQFGILKLDKHMPTTCSTDVLDINTDAKSAKREAGTIQAGLASNRDVAIPLPATTPGHLPDQPGLLLARPPPWPVWLAATSPTIRFVTTPWDPREQLIMPGSYSCVCCQVNILEWIWQRQIIEAVMVFSVSSALLVFDGSAVIARTTTMSLPTLTVSSIQPSNLPMWSIESEQEQHHMLGLLSPSACGQAEILGEVKRVYTAPFTGRFEIVDAGTMQPTVCECEETWFIGCFPSQQYTSSGQQRQWHVHMMVSLAPKLSTVTHTFAAGVIRGAEFFSAHRLLIMIIQDSHSTTEVLLQDLSASGNLSGNLVMLSISVPWDLGVYNELNTDELRSGFADQQSGEVLITASSCDSFACHMCTWAVYWDCLGKHRGAQHQYIAYNSHPRLICRIAHYHWSYLDLYELSTTVLQSDLVEKHTRGELLIPVYPCDDSARCLFTYGVCSKFRRFGMKATGGVVFVHLTNLSAVVQSTIGNMLTDLSAASTTCEIPLGNILIMQPGKHPMSVQATVNWCLFFPGRCVYPMSAQLPQHDDQVGYADSASVTMPWDLGRFCHLELWFAHPTGKQFRHSPSDKLNQLSDDVRRLWDPGSSSRRPAWGQAGFQGGGNVMKLDREMGRG